jgi:hypothetical protein
MAGSRLRWPQGALLLGMVLLFVCGAVGAQSFSHILSFQGRLCDPDGKPLPDGPYAVQFTIYDTPGGGNNLWQETLNVTQVGGVFNAYLGAGTPFPANLFSNGDRWLGIQVEGDPEMANRVRLAPSPWAIYAAEAGHAAQADHAANADHAASADSAAQAANADKVDGYHAAAAVTPNYLLPLDAGGKWPLATIPQGSGSGLDADKVDGFHAGNAVNQVAVSNGIRCTDLNADLLDGKDSSQYAAWPLPDNCVRSNHIVDGQVATADLADSAVTSAKIAIASVTTAKLADDAVATAKIAEAAVTSSKIAAGAVTSSKIAAGAVGTTGLADASVTTAKIANDAVTVDKLAHNINATGIGFNADMVDGYHAGNASGQVAVSNGTLCTNLNADKVDGYHAGNSSGQVALSNGTLCASLNADQVDGYNAGNASGQVALSNGTLCTNLNADKVDGYHVSDLDGRYVNEGQSDSITSAMIADRTIDDADVGFMRWGEWWGRTDQNNQIIFEASGKLKVYLANNSNSIYVTNLSGYSLIVGYASHMDTSTSSISRQVVASGGTTSFDVAWHADISLNATAGGSWAFFFKGIYDGSSNGAVIVGYYTFFDSTPLIGRGERPPVDLGG